MVSSSVIVRACEYSWTITMAIRRHAHECTFSPVVITYYLGASRPITTTTMLSSLIDFETLLRQPPTYIFLNSEKTFLGERIN